MALKPKIKICLNSDCKTLTVYETTGIYNAITNTGGYGFPNTELENIIISELGMIGPDGLLNRIQLFGEGFPSSNPEFGIEIDLSLINRTSIEDGYWEFLYTIVNDDQESYPYTASYYFYCNIECCISKLLNKIDIDLPQKDKQNNKDFDNYQKAKTLLGSLINSAKCFNTTNFNKIKDTLNKICKNSGCKTCN